MEVEGTGWGDCLPGLIAEGSLGFPCNVEDLVGGVIESARGTGSESRLAPGLIARVEGHLVGGDNLGKERRKRQRGVFCLKQLKGATIENKEQP